MKIVDVCSRCDKPRDEAGSHPWSCFDCGTIFDSEAPLPPCTNCPTCTGLMIARRCVATMRDYYPTVTP